MDLDGGMNGEGETNGVKRTEGSNGEIELMIEHADATDDEH